MTQRVKRNKNAAAPVRRELAVSYVRVSLDRKTHGMQDEIVSPDTQRDRAQKYCEAQGWTVVDVIEDIDESAFRQHYSKRKGLMRLLEMVEAGQVTKVVVWKFSRLSRKLKEFLELCDRIEAAGGSVVSVSEQVDTTTNHGTLIRNIMASFAQFQSEELSEQIFETWMTIAKQGRRPGGLAPFGAVNKKGMLEPDPETHHHLLGMYSTFRDTGSVRAVLDYLVERRVDPPVADEWSLNTIRGILTNAVYIGQLDWAGEVFQGKWDNLVPEDLWVSVQEILAARKGEPGDRRDARLLTGMIRCAKCGRPMWTRYSKRSTGGRSHLARLYWCCSPTSLRRGCDIPAVDAGEVEQLVWVAVQTLLDNHDPDQLVAGAARAADAGRTPDLSRRRQQLLADKERVEQQVRELFDLLHDQSITREQFREMNQVYLDRIRAIAADLDQAVPISAGPAPAAVRQAAIDARAASTDEQRRRILETMEVQIIVGRDQVHLQLPETIGLRINLRARRVGQTWHFGHQYQTLTYRGHTLTDKQERFIRKTYAWADKQKLAERLGRDYPTLITVARRLRRDGVLPDVLRTASREVR